MLSHQDGSDGALLLLLIMLWILSKPSKTLESAVMTCIEFPVSQNRHISKRSHRHSEIINDFSARFLFMR